MHRIIDTALGAAALLGLGLAAPANAQSRVFVAAQGSDSSPCTFAAPCRTFQRAHDIVAANGEIDVLDPAGYGALTITKAISIQGHGFSGISAASGNAITINAGANDDINLRGLLIDGVATGTNGIAFSTGGSLNIQDTFVRNFASSGISFAPSASSTLMVINTHLVANGSHGVSVFPTGPNSNIVSGTFEHVLTARNGGDGFFILGSTGLSMRFTIANSTISENAFHGIVAAGSNIQGVTQVTVRNSVVSNQKNGTGLLANTSAFLRASGCTITANNVGVQALNGGAIESYSGNFLANLSSDGVWTVTVSLQ
jgi:hypothetical protein